MVVGEAPRLGVIDRERADQPVVEDERAHQRRLQRRLAVDVGGLEVGARPRVHERPQVAAHPALQPLAVGIDERLQPLGVDTGREPAAQQVPVSSCRNSAQVENGTRLLSFDEMSAIVSATPRLVPIDCAIS